MHVSYSILYCFLLLRDEIKTFLSPSRGAFMVEVLNCVKMNVAF